MRTRKPIAIVAGLATLAALGLGALTLTPEPASAATPTLKGVVGPGETIAISRRSAKAGTYRLTVQDRSDEHNFHLRGAGVNVATNVGATGTKTFTVRLRAGKTYTFVCDPHSDEMRGTFRVRA